mgnify:FL=1
MFVRFCVILILPLTERRQEIICKEGAVFNNGLV